MAIIVQKVVKLVRQENATTLTVLANLALKILKEKLAKYVSCISHCVWYTTCIQHFIRVFRSTPFVETTVQNF